MLKPFDVLANSYPSWHATDIPWRFDPVRVGWALGLGHEGFILSGAAAKQGRESREPHIREWWGWHKGVLFCQHLDKGTDK